MSNPEVSFHRAGIAWCVVILAAEVLRLSSFGHSRWDGAVRFVALGAALALFALGYATRLLRERCPALSVTALELSFALVNTALVASAVSAAAGSGSLVLLAGVVLFLAAVAYAASVPSVRSALVPSPHAAHPRGVRHEPSPR